MTGRCDIPPPPCRHHRSPGPWPPRRSNPSHALFTEPDYLLAEDPKLRDGSIYHAVWEAVANGATTPTQIGSLVGMDTKSLSYHLTVMRDGGFLRHEQDLLLQRRPVITVADPVVRFHNLVVKPNLLDFEMRNTEHARERSRATFSSKIEGTRSSASSHAVHRLPLPDTETVVTGAGAGIV